MNIFVLDTNPVKAAIQQCDKHVVKMIVESAQMLSTAHRMLDGQVYTAPSKSGKRIVKHYSLEDSIAEQTLYKVVHANHPCTVWTMESACNYEWHYKHFEALCDEYTYRYGKTHKTDMILRSLLKKHPKNISNKGLTPFALAMKSNPECMFDDPVKSYRAFYKTKTERFSMKWSRRESPNWFHG